MAGEEPEKGSIYILHLTARTRKFKKGKLLDWLKVQAAQHGADTVILDRADPEVQDSDSGVLDSKSL